MKNIQTFEKYFGGNSGYIGYSMSKRAKDARNDGKYPKTDFKKEYNITENSLKSLIDTDYINNNEWHHTSKYGNKTIFYSWAEEYYYDIYINNKKQIDKISSNKDLTRQETIDKIKYFFENSEIYKNEEIKKDKQSEIDKYNRHIWSEYQTKKLNLDKKISSIDSKINKQFEENLPQNKLSRSHSGALFYNHYENGENSGVNIVPNVLNNITWRERILNNFNIYKHIDIKTKTKVAYIQDADIAFNKIDKKLFMEKQKLEKQKEEEQLLYKKNLENFRKNENIEIDNFTARYYDNYDDDEDEDENQYEENSIDALKKIQMFEEFNPILERISDIVYHFTYIRHLKDILTENIFHASTNIGASVDFKINKGKFFFFSTTRSKSSGFTKGDVKLVLDGQKLSQNYKGIPVDYWQYSKNPKDWDKYSYKDALKSEMEDRIILDSPTIKNATKYIKEIHILLNKSIIYISKDDIEYIISKSKQFNIPTFFYDNEKNWYNQIKHIDPYTIEYRGNSEIYVDENKISYPFLTIASLLSYNDSKNYNLIIKNTNFDTENVEILDKQIKKDTWNYFKNSNIDEYYYVIKSYINNYRGEKSFRFLFKLLSDDMKKYKVIDLYDYIKLKTKLK